MSAAIGTFAHKNSLDLSSEAFVKPHEWSAACGDDGEGPCFDARWVERSLAVEVAEPSMEPVSHLAAGLAEIASLLD